MSNATRVAEIIARAMRPGGLGFQVRSDPPGTLDVPAMENVILGVQIGGPTRVDCYRAGKHFSGTAVHGDIDVIPQLTAARWEIVGEEDRIVVLSLPPAFLQAAVEELKKPDQLFEVLNRFQARDPVLAALGTAVARELEDGCPSGGLYLDGIALAAASRLIACHSTVADSEARPAASLSGHRLKQVLALIEEQLAQDLSLQGIAAAVGLSSSHLTTLFRKAMGTPVYQYVVRRRVERAKELLQEGTLSVAEVALAVGFAHQSHMARHMVRTLGVRPSELRRGSHKSSVQ